MIKTIKVKKKLRLDELIKYVWENSTTEKRVFLGNHGQRVVFDNVGGFYPSGYAYSPNTTFTVEVEEPITEDTEFQTLVAADAEGDACLMYKGTIDEIRDSITTEIYANINGKLQLIWEAE